MNLLELARRWLRPGAVADTEEDFREQEAFNKRVCEIWLKYHDNELWAQRKLAAGLNLTPEALSYMENEVNARRMAAEAQDRLKQEMEQSDAESQPVIVVPGSGRGESHAGDAGNRTTPGGEAGSGEAGDGAHDGDTVSPAAEA